MYSSQLTLKQATLLRNGTLGAGWILYGILRLFNTIPCIVLSLVIILGMAILFMVHRSMKKEKYDEMALAHLQKARDNVYMLGMVALFIAGIVSFIRPIELRVDVVFPFAAGIWEVALCGFFLWYEKVGA